MNILQYRAFCWLLYKNYQDGRFLWYYVSNISGVDTEKFVFVLRWYIDMYTATVWWCVSTNSCMATDIFIVEQFSK